MDQGFLDETVGRKSPLFAAMVDFNHSQLKSETESSLSEADPAIVQLVLNDASILRAYRKNTSPSSSRCWWDFAEETRRLILLSPDILERLALCFSAAVFAEEMALTVDGKQVLALRTLLGTEIFAYAIRRGRYQIGSIRQTILTHFSVAPLAERILLLARSVLLLVGESCPLELKELWLQKLSGMSIFSSSASSNEMFVSSALLQLSREQRRALWFTLKKILLREVAPQWAPCFD